MLSQKGKVILFVGSLMGGGAERVVSILSNRLFKEGYNVEILVYYDEEIFYRIEDGVKVTVIERITKSRKLVVNLNWIRKYIKSIDCTLVSFLAPMNMVAITACLGTKTRIIVADRNDPRFIPANRIIRRIRNILYNRADKVVVQTQRNYDYFPKRIRRKCVIIFNPVEMREKSGLALQTKKQDKIVYVGRLIEQKNPLMIIQAFESIKDTLSGFKLYMFGEGNLREELESYISHNGLSKRVLLPGIKKDVFSEEKDARLFVLASKYEGMPNALIEAMCLGLPVVSTKVSGATDLIENNVNGLLIDTNIQELANAMSQVLTDEVIQQRFGENAVKVIEKVNVDVVIKQWVDLISSVNKHVG